MLLIPAIDLKDGKCVRLRQGRMEDDTVFSDNPVEMAGRWVTAGGRRLCLRDEIAWGQLAGREPLVAGLQIGNHRRRGQRGLSIGRQHLAHGRRRRGLRGLLSRHLGLGTAGRQQSHWQDHRQDSVARAPRRKAA